MVTLKDIHATEAWFSGPVTSQTVLIRLGLRDTGSIPKRVTGVKAEQASGFAPPCALLIYMGGLRMQASVRALQVPRTQDQNRRPKA